MDLAGYLSHLDRQTEDLLAAAEGKFEHEVPSCPKWTVRDLVQHVWEVVGFWSYIVEHRIQNVAQLSGLKPATPSDNVLVASVRQLKDRAIDLLRETDQSTPIWNWSTNKTVSFVPRRLANELSVHRWDAQNAGGVVDPIPTELAQDGLDEWVNVFVASGWMRFAGEYQGDGVVRILETDRDRSWKVRLVDHTAEVGGEDATVTVSGSASDLILLMWRRVGTGSVEIEGDRTALDHFLDWKEAGS